MKLIVIIVTYNGMKWIDKCLKSVFQSSVSSDVFIIDNGSTDGTVEHIKSNYGNVILHESDVNLGFGKANNLGLRYAVDNSYDYVYLLNQDAWVEEYTFQILISQNQKNPTFGILSPLQKNAEKTKLDVNFSRCCPPEMISDALCQGLKEIYTVGFVMAAHWLISIDCVKIVGGFSPTFPHYGEDDNYIDRAHLHGFKVGIVTLASSVHDRENRIRTIEQNRYMGYIANLKMLSDFTSSKKMLRLLNNCLMQFVNSPSKSVLKYCFRVFKEYNGIMRNRKTSFRPGAFL